MPIVNGFLTENFVFLPIKRERITEKNRRKTDIFVIFNEEKGGVLTEL